MGTQDVYSVYDRFGNLFSLDYNKGSLHEFPREPQNQEEDNATVYWKGRYFTFLSGTNSSRIDPSVDLVKQLIIKQFQVKVYQKGYSFQTDYAIYHQANEVQHDLKNVFSMYKGFIFRVYAISGNLFLCVDPHLTIITNASIQYLAERCKTMDKLSDFSVRWKTKSGQGIEGYLINTEHSTGGTKCRVKNYGTGSEEEIDGSIVYPESRPELLEHLLLSIGQDISVVSLQRRLSFLDSKEASRDRLFETLEIVKNLGTNIFPLMFGDFSIKLDPNSIVVRL